MTTYDKLRKRIYEIIYPEGIPLEFGCEIESKHTTYTICGESKSYTEGHYHVMPYRNGNGCIRITEDDKILGKPLSLQNVFMAITKQGNFIDINMFTEGLVFRTEAKYKKDRKRLLSFNLSLPIKDQSEEVLQNILNMLN